MKKLQLHEKRIQYIHTNSVFAFPVTGIFFSFLATCNFFLCVGFYNRIDLHVEITDEVFGYN